jgi:single-stranded-DNA-specific exonuclease
VVYKPEWHKGVIGIVASRLIETYYRPTLVFTKNGEKLAASARSVSGFDVYNALQKSSEFIEQFGGHKYAAGLTLLENNYQNFKYKFEEVVKKTIPKELLNPEIKIDQEIELSEISEKFYRVLKLFGPFGPANLNPVFLAKNLKDTGYSKRVGADKAHLKLSVVSEKGNIKMNGIGFNLGHWHETISNGRLFDAVFTIDENQWNGTTSLQLNIKDIKIED